MILRFADTVPQSGELVITRRITGKGTLKNLYCKFYGSKKLLKVKASIIFRGLEIDTPMLNFLGAEQELSGDFEEFDEKLGFQVQAGDIIKIHAINEDSTTAHSLNLNINMEG